MTYMDLEPDTDIIRVYISDEGPDSSRYRWTRRTTTNWKIVGASSEGYSRLSSAMANIKRTQREPYIIVKDF